MDKARLGLFGATSLVGECLSPLLAQSGWHVVSFSRKPNVSNDTDIEWRRIESHAPLNPAHSVVEREGECGASKVEGSISSWICLAPIWVLPDYFELLEAYGVKRIVALSSTSRFTKSDSQDPADQELANRFAAGEVELQRWAESKGIDWVIIRPTLIYGLGLDSNITQVASFIRR
ncbi:MAG: NAD(P)-dependent oxidoreductase, partial [bacterium]|nr:NAD(P)-dependent oxidoreductase [bacterium]